jgi:hypothetical protein
MPVQPPNRRASRLNYREFRRAYKLGTLDQTGDEEAKAGESPSAWPQSDIDKKIKRRPGACGLSFLPKNN